MLQRTIERLFLENKPLEDLQGWVFHYASIFVFGGVAFDLKESVERVLEAVNICAQAAHK